MCGRYTTAADWVKFDDIFRRAKVEKAVEQAVGPGGSCRSRDDAGVALARTTAGRRARAAHADRRRADHSGARQHPGKKRPQRRARAPRASRLTRRALLDYSVQVNRNRRRPEVHRTVPSGRAVQLKCGVRKDVEQGPGPRHPLIVRCPARIATRAAWQVMFREVMSSIGSDRSPFGPPPLGEPPQCRSALVAPAPPGATTRIPTINDAIAMTMSRRTRAPFSSL